MKIFLSVGHSILRGGQCTSASGIVNEYQYNKAFSRYLKVELERLGHTVDLCICPEYRFRSAREERNYKLPIVNSRQYNLVIELHLNAAGGHAQGSECYYYYGDPQGFAIASRCCKALNSLGFRNRGAKTKDLYMINETKPTAILLESFFCDNSDDCKLASELGYEKIAQYLAAAISNTTPKKKKPQCVMYYRDGNAHVANTIALALGLKCFKDNGKDLPREKYSDYELLYIGDYGRDRAETCKIALNKFLGTDLH